MSSAKIKLISGKPKNSLCWPIIDEITDEQDLGEDNINIGDILLCDELYYETLKGEKIYICHGDQFDGFIRLHPFLYVLGDWAYELSFKINKTYNWFRRIFGLEYWSLSQYLKSKVKNAIAFINDFKILSLKKLDEVGCDSIMIGHIHTPAIEKIGDKSYYNTGDFCESCSFLYEDLNGEIKLVVLDQEKQNKVFTIYEL